MAQQCNLQKVWKIALLIINRLTYKYNVGLEFFADVMVGKTSSDDELDTPDSPGLPNLTPPYRSRSKKSVLKPLTELSDEERAEKLKQQSLTNEYHRFVEGHLILKQGKEQTIFSV